MVLYLTFEILAKFVYNDVIEKENGSLQDGK